MVWSIFGFKPPRVFDDDASKSVEEAFQCDYDKNCTPLFKAIEKVTEKQDWDPIVRFLETGYWPGNLFADSLSPAEQARTWVTQFDPNTKSTLKWSQLPLHFAIICDAPYEVIKCLIESYPKAVRCTDDQSMLPLHLAMRCGSPDKIVALLLEKFPDSVTCKGKDDLTPFDCALRAKDNLRGSILQYFVKKWVSEQEVKSEGIISNLKSDFDQKEAEYKAQLSKAEAELSAKEALKDAEKRIVGQVLEELVKAHEVLKSIQQGKGSRLLRMEESVASLGDLRKRVESMDDDNSYVIEKALAGDADPLVKSPCQ